MKFTTPGGVVADFVAPAVQVSNRNSLKIAKSFIILQKR